MKARHYIALALIIKGLLMLAGGKVPLSKLWKLL